MNNSLLYLLLSAVCLWLILDQFVGKHLLSQFIIGMFPDREK